ncbi:unnamed protein product [Callosobruchus maculatus]|uniref:Mitochondrial 2-oxoglutarate/malate carrier protein n=1 Tax=Callosobruchus maculatus TaxID=64391 RepID=A0A653D9E2_CALMS|nr:unnamed protein product [Callosobruchus maculatus]
MQVHDYLQYCTAIVGTMNLTHGNCSIIPVPPYTEEFNNCIDRFIGDYYTQIEGLYKLAFSNIPVVVKLFNFATMTEKQIPNGLKFLFGGSAGMGATVFVQPLDLIKNRMQLSKGKEYPTSLHAARGIIAKEGFCGLYNGLSAGLFRQATYTTARLGIYTFLFDKAKSSDGKPPGFAVKAAIGMISGMCGAFVGTPAEVALIRMTADGRLPPAERRNYSNVFNALSRIVKEEGLLTLWRGAVPTMGRAMVVNAAQLASYSQLSEGIFLHFVASMISGLITTAASMPVDIAKTRIQNMKTIDGKPEFKGPLDVLGKVIRNEGVFALWKGFMPYYFRLGPHTVLTFIFLEQMNAAYFKHVLGEEKRGGL